MDIGWNAERRASDDGARVGPRTVVVFVHVRPGDIISPGGTWGLEGVAADRNAHSMMNFTAGEIIARDGADREVVVASRADQIGNTVSRGVPHTPELCGQATADVAPIVERYTKIGPQLAWLR